MAPVRLLLTLITLPALALGACSEEEGLTDDEQEYADALSASLEDDEEGFGLPADDAQCMGEVVMTELGVEPFEEADVTPADIESDSSFSPGSALGGDAVSDEQASTILDGWDECSPLPGALAPGIAEEFDLGDEAEACIEEGLAEDDLVRDLLVPSFTEEDDEPDDDTLSSLLDLLEECGAASGEGGPLVQGITESLLEGSSLTEEQARCLAQGVVDELGAERMGELFSSGAFEDLSAEGQNEVAGALVQAASTCDVPLTAFG